MEQGNWSQNEGVPSSLSLYVLSLHMTVDEIRHANYL